MSRPIIEKPRNPIDRCQAVTDLIESVALMETGLSHIINAEGEKIQKVVNYDSREKIDNDDLLKINKSVEDMIITITNLEIVLQNKLELAKELNCHCCKEKHHCCNEKHHCCNEKHHCCNEEHYCRED